MSQTVSLEKWYAEGAFSPHVTERRLVASTPSWMLDVCQPPGDFPDPPLREMVVIQDKSRALVSCDFGAGKFTGTPGAIYVVPSQSATQISVENAHQIRCLGFLPNTLGDWSEYHGTATDLGHIHATALSSPFLHQLMNRIWDEGAAFGSVTSLYSDTALTMLWAELLREARYPVEEIARGGLAPWQIRRCKDFLNTHACENIGLEQLADLANLSPFHFARAFKRSTGLPPHRYQLMLRIERAKVLLETTELSVTTIAFDVGYESSQALARLFRRETGLSPSEYRRQLRL